MQVTPDIILPVTFTHTMHCRKKFIRSKKKFTKTKFSEKSDAYRLGYELRIIALMADYITNYAGTNAGKP